MKKSVKLLALFCAVFLVLSSFAGCDLIGSSGDSNKLSGSALITKGKLVVGTNAEFAPFEYLEDGEVVGIDIDIIKEIAKALDLEVVIKDMEFNTLPTALSAGTIDCIAAGFTADATREETMDFTTSYYNASQSIIVTEASPVASKEDLSGLTIGVQSGTTGEKEAAAIVGADNVKGYASGMLAVQDLVNGNVQAVIIDNAPANVLVDKYSGTRLIEGQFVDENYVYAVKKGNSDLQNALDDALSDLIDDGKVSEIVSNYID